MTINFRRYVFLGGLALLAACAVPADVNEPAVAMGDFELGLNIVVVNEPQIGPFSRSATDAEWQAELTAAMERRFGGYHGEKFYNFGVKLDGYALAMPGVPIVFTPKSFLVVTVGIWDDATATRLNEEEKAFSVFEGFSENSLIGSGLTQNKAQQMTRLADNAAKAIQDWVLENPQWVGLPALADATPDAGVVN